MIGEKTKMANNKLHFTKYEGLLATERSYKSMIMK
jgi:hypothetical protein